MSWPKDTIEYTPGNDGKLPLIEVGDWIHVGVYSPWMEVVRAFEPHGEFGKQTIIHIDPRRGEELHCSGHQGYYGIARLSKGRKPE